MNIDCKNNSYIFFWSLRYVKPDCILTILKKKEVIKMILLEYRVSVINTEKIVKSYVINSITKKRESY